ncbi:hypothetical protein TanjilG_02441 [Lupinus angustifolius]|uniref:Uncharacterized protein n=1 Tax=Lupinus angustifolius TaxID=3871 RepID=A0A1J7ITQ1_LUPAN|nr:hypothetical protein TanjilG_02441 [Lupinus angustifolius]
MSGKGGAEAQGQRTSHPTGSFSNLPVSRSQIKNDFIIKIIKAGSSSTKNS